MDDFAKSGQSNTGCVNVECAGVQFDDTYTAVVRVLERIDYCQPL